MHDKQSVVIKSCNFEKSKDKTIKIEIIDHKKSVEIKDNNNSYLVQILIATAILFALIIVAVIKLNDSSNHSKDLHDSLNDEMCKNTQENNQNSIKI